MAGAEPTPPPASARGSDLPVRLASAAVLLALTIGAIWLGGAVLDTFIVLVALAAFVEFVLLVVRATPNVSYRLAAIVAGAVYFGLAAMILAGAATFLLILVIGVAVFTDTGAFFAGRAVGGPRIAPSISPSKTWAGLVGGMIASALWVIVWVLAIDNMPEDLPPPFEIGLNLSFENVTGALVLGAGLAVVAQAGDFLESWLKRRAGVKDSSRLIPGHGGVFDRVDGLIPVTIVAGWIAVTMAP